MGDTNISGLGKILSGNEVSVSAGHLKESDVKVAFSEVMAQSNMKDLVSQELYNNTEVPKHRREEASFDTPPAADYEKFQYKDNKISEKTEYKDITESSVVEEKMTKFSEQVKDVLEEELGVSEEEIVNAMEVLGLSYPDLLNQNNLANLVAELTGNEDLCRLLCSEQFLNVMQEVNVLSQQLLQELGISMEELSDFMKAQELAGTADEAAVKADGMMQIEVPADETEVKADNTAMTEEAMLEAAAENTTEDISVKAETTMKASAEENANGKSALENAETTETVPSDETPIVTVKTEANEQQEEDASGEIQQQASEQMAVPEEQTDKSTQKPTFRQAVKETNEQAPGGVHLNQNTNVNQINGAEVMQNIPEGMSMREITEQLVDAAKVTVSADMTKMEMQLNPENLGKMYLEISEKDGVVSAKIQLQNEAVKEAVEAQLVELRQNLNQAGVKVDAVEVTVASHEFEKNLEQDAKRDEQQAAEQEKATKQRKINLNNLDDLSGLMSEEEALVAKMMAEQGNSIDFTA